MARARKQAAAPWLLFTSLLAVFLVAGESCYKAGAYVLLCSCYRNTCWLQLAHDELFLYHDVDGGRQPRDHMLEHLAHYYSKAAEEQQPALFEQQLDQQLQVQQPALLKQQKLRLQQQPQQPAAFEEQQQVAQQQQVQQPAVFEQQQQQDQQLEVELPAVDDEQEPNLQMQSQQHEEQQQHSQGRNLQQYAYNTAYDPYAGGVTPGFMNIDVNAVTGTHFDAGGVAVDISADQNYIGFSLGNAFGVGIARDRGYNIQIGGGNLADISVTKDAGIGLWLLNGLINLNYMPGGGWSLGTMAAQGSMSEAVAAGNVTMANVVVDDFSSSSSTPAAIPVIEVDGTTSSQVSTYYNDYGEVAVTSPSGSSSSSSSSSSISYTPAPAPSSSTYNTYSSTPSSSSASSGYLVSREATDYSDYGQQWSIESAYSDTAAMSAGAAASGGGVYSASSSSSSSAATASRRACQGGTVVAVSGSKFTCRYKRSPLVRVASNVKTYSNGIVA
jgi:hypothetical protein